MNTRDILINILTKGDPKGAEDIGSALDNVAERADKLGKTLSMRVTAPLVALGGAAVYVATQFDTAFSEVSTLLDAPASQIESLRGDIRDLANELGVDLVDATRAAYSALSAGVDPDGLIGFLETATRLGIGGVASTGEAVDLLTGVLNAYNMSVDEAARVSDVLFNTVRRGKTTIPELAASLGQLAPTAALAGVGFEELLGNMATVTATTGNTRSATTGLSAAISALLNPTDELAQIYDRLGVESGRQLIAQHGLAGALEQVRLQTGGSDQAFIRALSSIEAFRAAALLTGDNARRAAEDIAAMGDSAGATEAAFNKMEESVGRQFAKLKAASNELLLVLADQLLPTVLGLTETLTSMAQAASDLPPGLVAAGVAIGGLAAAAGPAIIVLGSVIRNLRLIAAISPKAALALKWAFAPAAALALGVALGTVAERVFDISGKAGDLYDAWDRFRAMSIKGTEDLAESLREAINAASDLESKEAAIAHARAMAIEAQRAGAEALADGNRRLADAYAAQAAELFGVVQAAQATLPPVEDLQDAAEGISETFKQSVFSLQEIRDLIAQARADAEDELAQRERALAGLRREVALLQARRSGDQAAIDAAQDAIDIAREQERLDRLGVLSAEESADAAQRLVALRRAANDAEERRRNEERDANEARLRAEREYQDLLRQRPGGADEEETPDERKERLGADRSERQIGIDGKEQEVFFRGGQRLGTEDQILDRRERFEGIPRDTPAATPSPAAAPPQPATAPSQQAPQINPPTLDTSGIVEAITGAFAQIQTQLDDLAGQIRDLAN